MPPGESKSYDPASVEQRIFAMWMDGGYFHPQPDARPREQRFCMVIPPPNVTGALHLGHALNNTLQDILVRQKRMAGFNTLWVVGTDHAGIATQATVEKSIRQTEGKSRHGLGREELVRRIWEWKEKYGSRIVEQLKLMGCSCDYSRERFTLDEGCAKAVRETFFKLFRDGLIYRGKRLVNWDTQLQTAVADDEVYHEEVKGHFYHFKYPIIPEGTGNREQGTGEPTHVHIATTRPETMLADTAVAVHPDPAGAMEKRLAELGEKLKEASDKERSEVQKAIDDLGERRTTLLPTLEKLRDMAKVGRKTKLPLMDREIPLICDEWADPTLGTGCVKITPAHDANDYAVQSRHPEIGIINVMTPDGRVSENGGKYAGQKFADARKNVVADLEALGLVEKIEDRMIDLGHSDRSKSPIEPYLSDQWFVRMGDLTAEEFARIQTQELKVAIEKSIDDPLAPTSGTSEPPAQARGSSRADPQAGASGSDRLLPGLAQIAIDAVKRGDVKINPERYAKTYTDWLGEKRDWCISRQLWWGHRIPVWSIPLAAHGAGGKNTKEIRENCNRSTNSLSESMNKLAQFRGLSEEFSIRVFDEHRPSICHLCARSDAGAMLFTEVISLNRAHHGAHDEPYQNPFAGQSDAEKHASAAASFISVKPEQDPDVLDTWFPSALWPQSTLGWPGGGTPPSEPRAQARGLSAINPQAGASGSDSEALLNYYYPTQVLSTAREIITLWVARMVITGLYNIGEVPFRDVFIHSVIQDGQGRKMSKTAGNGVDPVDIIEEYGADALRFTLADQSTETQDIRMPVKPKKLPDGRTINISERFEKGRNFCNKLWQASTGFVMRNLEGYSAKPLDPAKLRLEDRWILSRMTGCLTELNAALESYRFSEAAGAVYRFMWDEYCSWYIEMVKGRVAEGTGNREQGTGLRAHESRTGDDKNTAQQVLVFVLDRLLRMLHPFVPFVSEGIWQELNKIAPRRGLTGIFDAAKDEKALIAAQWPRVDARLRNEAVESQMERLQAIIKAVRDIRADVNDFRGKAKQPSVRSLAKIVVRADAESCKLIEAYRGFVMPLAGCDELEVGPNMEKPRAAMSRVDRGIEVYAPVADYVAVAEVRRAEAGKLDELRRLLSREQAKTANEDFVKRADPAVVEQSRQRAVELSSQIALLEQHLQEMN